MAAVITTGKIKNLFSSFLSTSTLKDKKLEHRKEVNLSNIQRDTDQTLSQGNNDDPVEETDIPHRTPVSRNKTEFNHRVASFSPVTWCAKPRYLSPLVCARYGWLNVDTDMLQCEHCRAFLCGQLPKSVNSKHYKESCQKLVKNLTESHITPCKWLATSSPESFTQIPYGNRKELFSEFCERVTSLVDNEDFLPEVSYNSVNTDGKGITEEDFQAIVKKICDTLKVKDIHCSDQVVIYGICGWSYHESQKGVKVLQCNYFCRKVGLWNFRSAHSTTNETQTEEPSIKKQKLEKTNFDPVGEHRYWCPWLQVQNLPVSEDSQSLPRQQLSPMKPTSPETLNSSSTKDCHDPGWLYVAKLLSGHKFEGAEEEDFVQQMKQSPQIEGLRHLRHILKDCTSPSHPTKD